MSNRLYYSADIERAVSWWRKLQGREIKNGKQINSLPDCATLARLRRCDRPIDALWLPATISLISQIVNDKNNECEVSRVAGLAIMLAHLRNEDEHPLLVKLGCGHNNNKATLRLERLKRVIRVEATNELVHVFRRLLALAKGQANPYDLADSFLNWGDKKRKKWAFQYYQDILDKDKPNPRSNDPKNTENFS